MSRAGTCAEGGEGGASALAVTWWGLVMTGVALAVVAGGVDVAVSYARARAAADAAALAGAGAHPLAGGDGAVCAAAARLASRNDAELAGCRVTGRRAATLRVTVTADVKPGLALLRRALGPATAEAAAGLAPADPPGTETRARTAGDRHASLAVALTLPRARGGELLRRGTPHGASGKRYDSRSPAGHGPGQGPYPRTQEQRQMSDARADPASADGGKT